MKFRRDCFKGRNGFKKVLLVFLTMAIGVAVVYGTNAILTAFGSHYPSTTIPQYTEFVTGDACLDCHTSNKRGDPGNAYRENLIATGVDFTGLDFVDSDGDGVDNQTEANTTRADAPVEVDGVLQVGYNPGLIDCPDGKLGYDPVSMKVITGVHETPMGGVVWSSEDPLMNCGDGLDNDCDGLKDMDDPDCAAGCGADADCSDGLFCNGAEVCISGECLPGTAPAVDDGIDCTVDFCDEDGDTVLHVPNNSLCDDGLFCNGAEVCDAAAGCAGGVPPCLPGETCDESNDVCVLPAECASDADCDDGLFCNGAEFCDPFGQCQPGAAPVVDDGIVCTSDFCDEANDIVVHDPLDTACDDGLFCNGAEACDPGSGCQAGTLPCAAGEACDEQMDVCVLEVLDLDIAGFRAPKRATLSRGARDLVLVVRNAGTVEGSAEATLRSVNESGASIVQTQTVTDPVGNGRSKFVFPFPTELGTGLITHTVSITDEAPDIDEATATTTVFP